MSNSSDSWETASQEEIKYTKSEIKKRKTIQEARLILLHKVLLIMDCLQKPRKYFKSTGLNDFEKLAEIQKMTSKDFNDNESNEFFTGFFNRNGISDQFDVEISKFLSLNLSGIPTRLYFVVGNEIITFIEYKINNNYSKETKKFNGNCFSVDMNGNILDQTLYFSKNCTHHSFFSKIINSINKLFNSNFSNEYFKDLDDQRMKVIPLNLTKMKLHPLYITEECCNKHTAIYPKRPIFGYFKGSPVYSRKNIIKLKTEKSWYMNGRIRKIPETNQNSELIKPYRIIKDMKLFAEFQTESISIEDLTCNEMEAFHPNFTPKNCVYLDCESTVPREVGIPYSECIVALRQKEKVKRGIFVRKEDCFVTNYLVKEHRYFAGIFSQIEAYESLMSSWKKFLTKLKKFIEIKRRVG